MKNKIKKGFSLVELLVVITIIAILSVVAYTAVGGQTIKARNSKRQQDLSSIQAALELYAIENNNIYPDELDDGNTSQPEKDLVPKYMPKMAVDPATKQKYSYGLDGNKRTYQLATVLEDETGTHKAYVIGNGTDLIGGVKTCGKVKDGSTTCLPYEIQ